MAIRPNRHSLFQIISKGFNKYSSAVQNTHGYRPLRISSGELARLRTLPRLTLTKSKLAGRTISIVDAFWFLHSYKELCVDESYRFISKRTDPYIIDCGANVGLSVIYFKHLYPDARIIAFEPDPEIFNALAMNISSFALKNVTLVQKAVWNSDGTAEFKPDGSLGGRIVSTNSASSNIKISTVRLRDWLVSPIDMLKLDIEGAECEVLKDCQDRLGNVDHLFVEYHGKPNEPQCLHEILEILERAGFRYYIKDAYPIMHPFMIEERRRMYDLQSNIFAFRA